jgi:hypothetical protein
MSQDFEKWLIDNRKRDENVISGEKIIEEVRQKIQGKVIKHLKETEDQDKEIIGSLAYAGLEYLLGENFNGAAALYYYSYFLLQGNGKK